LKIPYNPYASYSSRLRFHLASLLDRFDSSPVSEFMPSSVGTPAATGRLLRLRDIYRTHASLGKTKQLANSVVCWLIRQPFRRAPAFLEIVEIERETHWAFDRTAS